MQTDNGGRIYAVSSLAQSSTLPGHRSGIPDGRAAGCEKVLTEQVPSVAEHAQPELALDCVREGDSLAVRRVTVA
jgi:hypothetical protein